MIPVPGYYWPPGAIEGDGLDALVSAFEAIGYEMCTCGESQVEGFEKVVLYVDSDGDWTHAAKQLEDGEWSSKLGDEEDIQHRSPHGLASKAYGSAVCYMRRRLAGTDP